MEDKNCQLTACEKQKTITKTKKMISLKHLLIIPIIFTGLVLIISVNKIKKNQYKLIEKIRDLSIVEEKYFTLANVIAKYFSHLIDIRRNLPSCLMIKSYWYETIEIYKKIKLYTDIKEFNKTNGRLGLLSGVLVFLGLMLIWAKFIRTSLMYQNLIKILRREEENHDSENRDKGEKKKNKIKSLILNALDFLLALDAISLAFVLLTGWIIPIVFLSNWTSIEIYNDYYVVIILGLEVFLLGVFLVIDLIMFYILFESILPLLFVLIGLYGAAQKFRAGYYLFLYTLLGSLFMLLSFVKLGGDSASTFFDNYSDEGLFQLLQQIVWTVLFVSFSVKTPLVPVHIWLPLAHSDANVSGSIILASVVLKLALYGFIRILIGLLLLATARLTNFFLGYCSMSLLFSSFTTVRQFDLKVLVAYSSIAHMASSLLGTFSDTLYGLMGSIIFGLAHGFVSPGLFIIVGAVLYDRCGTRIMNYFKGLSNILPFTSLIFLILVFGNMGVPLTGNFIGEFLSLLGAYQKNIFIGTIGTISVITSAIYSINTYNKTTSGSISPYILTIPDLFRKEYYTLLPLIVLTLILGVYPSFISSDIEFGLSSNLLLLPSWPEKKNENGEYQPNPLRGNESEDEDGNENIEFIQNSNMDEVSSNENSNSSPTETRIEDPNPNIQEGFNYDVVLAPGTRAPHNTPASSPVLSTAKPRESGAERAAHRLDGAKRREGPSDTDNLSNKRQHRDTDPDAGPDGSGSGSSGGITHFCNQGVNSNSMVNWEDLFLLENIPFSGIKSLVMFIIYSRFIWKEREYIKFSLIHSYIRITRWLKKKINNIKKKINNILGSDKKGITIITCNIEEYWTEIDYFISSLIFILIVYIIWRLIKLLIKLISFSYRYLIKVISNLVAYPVEKLKEVFKRISQALNVRYQCLNLLLLLHQNRINTIILILIIIIPKVYNGYLTELPIIFTMDPSFFENLSRSWHLWDQSMEYHSNIKEYQSNIMDTSESKINLSEGNSPSSDSNVNMSEVNSQPAVSADNSPAPAPADNVQDLTQNAPTPATADIVEREDCLEDEANNRIDNLNNALDQEEDLAEKIGVAKQEIKDSIVVNQNDKILLTTDNIEKVTKDLASSTGDWRPTCTPCELEAEKDIVKVKEDELSNITEWAQVEIDRLKDIAKETGRDTTRRVINEALADAGYRERNPSPVSNVGGNNSGKGNPRRSFFSLFILNFSSLETFFNVEWLIGCVSILLVITIIYFVYKRVGVDKNIHNIGFCMPLSTGSETTWVSIEYLNILWIGWIVFILYQIGIRIDQFIIILINDHPNLINNKKNILLFGKLTFSILILFTVSLIIGDIWYDLSSVIMPASITASKSNKIISIVKCFLVFILKSLLIFIDYKLSGLKSRKFIFTLISLILFITFTILIYSDCLSLSEVYKVCTILTSAFILDWLGIPNITNPCISTVLPDISNSDIEMPSNDHSRTEESLANRNKNKEWVPQNKNRLYKSTLEWREAQQRMGLPSSMDDWWEAHHGIIENENDISAWGLPALNEDELEFLDTPTPKECIEKISEIDKCLSDITDLQRGKKGTQNHWHEHSQPHLTKEESQDELRRDKKILGVRLNMIWGEIWKKKSPVLNKRPIPIVVNRQSKIWRYGRQEKARAHVRKDRFKFYKEVFKQRGNSSVRDEIKKWD